VKRVALVFLAFVIAIFVSGCIQQRALTSTTINTPTLSTIATDIITTSTLTQTSGKATTTTVGQTGAKNASQVETTALVAQKKTIAIMNFAFNPPALSIDAGTTVTWVNEESATHTIKSATFNSGKLSKGDTFQFKFNEKGTYNYSCGIHPSMKGTITVK
jgi:plastocyanin